MRDAEFPLAVKGERFWLFGISLALVSIVPSVKTAVPHFAIGDWSTFYKAGAVVGTRRVISPEFPYVPGMAWFFAPLAHVPPVLGYAATVALMLLAAAVAALVAARVYGLNRWVALLLTIAWAPTMHAVLIGQNATVALLLMVCATAALVDGRSVLAGIAIGLLLYKPTYALAFVVLLFARREWRALAVVALCSVGWYLASVCATGGDWGWPMPFVQSISLWYHAQFDANAFKAISAPSLLERIGVPTIVAAGVGFAMLLACIPKLARAPILEAASVAPLIGLATSPHAWEYDACLVLPVLFWALRAIDEPWRTRIVGVAFAIALLWPLSSLFQFDPIALLVLGGAGYWYGWQRGGSSAKTA